MTEGNIHVYGDTEETAPKTTWDKRKEEIYREVTQGSSADNTDSPVETASLDRTVDEFDESVERSKEVASLKVPLSKDFTALSSTGEKDKNKTEEKESGNESSEVTIDTKNKEDGRHSLSAEFPPEFTQFDTKKIVVEVKRLQERSIADIDAQINALKETRDRKNKLFTGILDQAKDLQAKFEQLKKL